MAKAVDVKFLVKLTQAIRIFTYFDTNYQSILCIFFLSEYPPCASIETSDRISCGWSGITKSLCISLGCCYDSGASSCFQQDGLSGNCKYMSSTEIFSDPVQAQGITLRPSSNAELHEMN